MLRDVGLELPLSLPLLLQSLQSGSALMRSNSPPSVSEPTSAEGDPVSLCLDEDTAARTITPSMFD